MILIQWLFVWSLITSTLVALSARIPIYTWARLEVNTIAFIPVILNPDKPESIRAAIKYFFIQAYASLIFLIGPLIIYYFDITIIIAIIIKLGISPFHTWYPAVMTNLSWLRALFLSTWQKIAPLWILVENLSNNSFIILLAALNAIIGGIGGLAQTEIRPLLAYSSIGHIGWILYTINFSNWVIIIYFLSYALHLYVLINLFKKAKIDTPKDLSLTSHLTLPSKYIIALTLLSLGGLPPLFGFIPKLIILKIRTYSNFIPIFLIIGRYINIYYYITLMWSRFLSSPQPFLSKHNLTKFIHPAVFITTSLSLLLICGLNIHL